LRLCRNRPRLTMYKNKLFRGRSAKSSTVSNAGSSAVGTPGSNVSTSTTVDTPVSSTALDTSNKRTPSPKKRGRPPGKKQSFPSEETFLAPAPSPKTMTPPRRKPMREANSSAESSPVLNVVRRKARRACDLDTAFYERILAVSGLKFELDGAKPHQLGLQICFAFACRFLFSCVLQTKSRFISSETCSSR
jgi:hypothetical protein